jgi:hypothetical protein
VTVDRKKIQDSTESKPRELDPWSQGFNEALRVGVKKGRIARDDAAVLRGLIYKPIRRKVEQPLLYSNLLERCQEIIVDLAVKENIVERPVSNSQNWYQHADWIADYLPQLYKQILLLMIEFPIIYEV